MRIFFFIFFSYYGEVDSGNESIGDFFEHYDVLLSELVHSSNFYRAPQIAGKLSYVEQESLRDDGSTGIEDLETNTPENNNFVNRFMKMIHS